MKPIHWIASTLRDLRDMPETVRSEAGFALYLAQMGDKAHNAVPLVGFGSAKVLEVVMDDDGSTYRAMYTVKFPKAVYVLHAFQKKSRKGKETPRHEMDLVKSRLNVAEQHYLLHYEQQRERTNERGA
jgi:phage-related protein